MSYCFYIILVIINRFGDANMIQDQTLVHRRSFIGGSDARTIMGDDETALLRLWQEKRGEVEPEDLSGNLLSSSGVRPRS
jgi:predicted phage-related endonuclease